VKSKTILLNIKDIRNRRAHDSPFNARDAYYLCDLVQRFFEQMKNVESQEVIGIFDQLRREALELLVIEESKRTTLI
jgi:DNA topoisomerase VI subunit A